MLERLRVYERQSIVSKRRVGILGGSGFYAMDGVDVKDMVELDTPFGEPSGRYAICEIGGREVVFLPRHGEGHRLLPSEINFRANIYGFKKLGVEWIIAASAVGSMKKHIKPLDVVVPDQFIDRTRGRVDTFFGNGVVAHISFADPVCPVLSSIVADAAEGCCTGRVHRGGTYLCMEGPAFSTKAESNLYRSWGVSVIGMTNLQEAKLAREAEICYATMALVTDYDCWHEEEEEVSVEMLLNNLWRNTATAQEILRRSIPAIPEERKCVCATALENAILTRPDQIPPETKSALDVIIGKYM